MMTPIGTSSQLLLVRHMGNRLSKIYTRTGDDGTSALADGSRLYKTDAIFIAMGDIDELNSQLGLLLAYLQLSAPPHRDNTLILHELTLIMHLLFNLGGELALLSDSDLDYQGITNQHIAWLENAIDTMNADLPYLKEFILPKGTLAVSQAHVARSTARRAERACVQLKKDGRPIRPTALEFINRLSDYLFVLARFITPANQVGETLWNTDILHTSCLGQPIAPNKTHHQRNDCQ